MVSKGLTVRGNRTDPRCTAISSPNMSFVRCCSDASGVLTLSSRSGGSAILLQLLLRWHPGPFTPPIYNGHKSWGGANGWTNLSNRQQMPAVDSIGLLATVGHYVLALLPPLASSRKIPVWVEHAVQCIYIREMRNSYTALAITTCFLVEQRRCVSWLWQRERALRARWPVIELARL